MFRTGEVMITSEYLSSVLAVDSLADIVKRTVKVLKPHVSFFDSIACRGMSGTLVAPAVALALKKDLIIVRKESSHSVYKVEGAFHKEAYVIVDDFVSSGNTIVQIINEIKKAESKHLPPNCVDCMKCYGVALYGMMKDVERIECVQECIQNASTQEIKDMLIFPCG